MTYVIAEIGVNHNNNLNFAKKIIDYCVKEKIDAVKFQTFSADRLALKKTPKVFYQKLNKRDNETHYEMLKKLQLSHKDHKILIDYCKKKKIEFISTPYDIESAKFLISLGVNYIKVASADLNDLFLHEYLSSTNKKIIISTGMSNMNNINDTLKVYKKKKNISILHCVSNYPCSNHSLNLNCLEELKKTGLKIGFSDHSKDFLASVIAISKGAEIIEKHITLSNQLEGPDHKTSLNFKNFSIFLNKIRTAKIILGGSEKKIQAEELEMQKISKKGLYYNKNLNYGKKITKKDLIALRPFNGFEVKNYKRVINNKLKKNVKKFDSINLRDF